jgi:hypothetical protein
MVRDPNVKVDTGEIQQQQKQQQQQSQPGSGGLESTALLSATLDEDAAASQMAAAAAGGKSWGVFKPHTRLHRVLSHVNESVRLCLRCVLPWGSEWAVDDYASSL